MAYKRKWSGSQSTQKSTQRAKYRRKPRVRRSRKLPLAVKVTRLARDLKPELKAAYFYNNAAQVGAIGSTDSLGIMNGTNQSYYISNWPICAMIEGDDEANRVGRKIRLKHIDFAFFARQQTNTHQSITIHFELVQWKQYVPSTYGTPHGIQNSAPTGTG